MSLLGVRPGGYDLDVPILIIPSDNRLMVLWYISVASFTIGQGFLIPGAL